MVFFDIISRINFYRCFVDEINVLVSNFLMVSQYIIYFFLEIQNRRIFCISRKVLKYIRKKNMERFKRKILRRMAQEILSSCFYNDFID